MSFLQRCYCFQFLKSYDKIFGHSFYLSYENRANREVYFLYKCEGNTFLYIFSASKFCYLVPIFPLVFLYRSHGCSLVVIVIGCGWCSSISQRVSSRVGVTDGCEEGFPVALVVKNPPANAGDIRDTIAIPGSGRSPGEGNGNPLQYPCLESPRDWGAWWAPVHRVPESDTTEATEHKGGSQNSSSQPFSLLGHRATHSKRSSEGDHVRK